MGVHERDEIMRLQAQLRQLRLDFEKLRADFARMKDGLMPPAAEDSPLQRAFEAPLITPYSHELYCDGADICHADRESIDRARERDERDRG